MSGEWTPDRFVRRFRRKTRGRRMVAWVLNRVPWVRAEVVCGFEAVIDGRSQRFSGDPRQVEWEFRRWVKGVCE